MARSNLIKRYFAFPQTGIVSMPDHIRNHMVATVAELAGTFLFLFFSLSICQIANTAPATAGSLPDLSKLLFISLGFGCSVAVNVWIFYRVSGGMFNPAVSLTLWLIGAIPAIRLACVFVGQMVGAIAAAAAVSATFPGPMTVDVRLGSGTSISRGLFIEMFATTQLVLTVTMLAVVKHKATYLAPIGIGIALFIGNMCSIYFSGAGINPVRAFAPDVVNHSFPHYHWIYWLGPALAALLTASFYNLLEAFGWRTANPGQDYNDIEATVQEPSEKAQQHGLRESDES